MRYVQTPLAGAFVIEIEPIPDERGFFAYAFDIAEAASHGLNTTLIQSKISFNHRAGTVRGMHWQAEPATETKLVRCTHGAVHDVIVDVRPGSPTYGQHFAVELSAQNHRTLYVPALFAHGYQTLQDDSEVIYQVSTGYAPQCERGMRFDDPALGIRWPREVSVVSAKDRNWPLLNR